MSSLLACGSLSGEMPSVLTGRSPRVRACHDVSSLSRPAGRGAANVPTPGWVTIRPSPASRASARDTVTGLTWRDLVSVRVDGSRSPGARRATSRRSQVASCSRLLSWIMRNKDTATVSGRVALPARRRFQRRTAREYGKPVPCAAS